MSIKKPVILVVAAANAPEIGVTGAAVGTETLVDMLEDQYQIDWLVLNTNGLGQLGARGIFARMISTALAVFASLEALAKLAWRGIAGCQVHILYLLPAASTMGILRNVAFILVARLLFSGTKIVFHIRNGNYFTQRGYWQKRVQRFVNKRADLIFVLSRTLLPCDFNAAGVKESQLSILPNTIDEGVLPKSLPKVSMPPPLKVLYLSNFIVEKGYLALLAAAERLAERGRAGEFVFTFHGKWLSQQERVAARAQADRLCARGFPVFMGDALYDRDEVQALYASHHVFCLPTLYAAEAQPRSVLEAMANGCVVLATRFRGIPEQVLDGETGILVEDQDPDRLAERLMELRSCDLRVMGQAGRAHFDKNFSKAIVHRGLLNSLCGLVNQEPIG